MGRRVRNDEDFEPVPTDGLEVVEARDADTVRLFLTEWRRRVIQQRATGPLHFDRRKQPRAMMPG